MTSLNVTITPDRAVVSQDRSLYQYDGLTACDATPTTDYAAAAASTFQGGAAAGTSQGDVCKIAVLERVLIGGAGSFAHTVRLPAVLSGSLDFISRTAPALLAQLVVDVHTDIPELLVIAAGFSDTENRVLGYAFERSTDFEPVRLDRGHSMAPVPNPSAPGYDRLAGMWAPAALGHGLEAFHRELHANQRWSCQQGLLRCQVSDGHDIASVDRHGARMV